MIPSWVLSLGEGVQLEANNGTEIVLTGMYNRLTIPAPSRSAADALRKLSAPGESIERMMGLVHEADGPAAAAAFCTRLRQIINRGYVEVSVQFGDQPLATLIPIACDFKLPAEAAGVPASPVLSRFAFLRRFGEYCVLESPLAKARVLIQDPRAAAVIHALCGPAFPSPRPRPGGEGQGEGASAPNGFPAPLPSGDCDFDADPLTQRLLELLAAAGMLTEAGAKETAEDENPALRTWEFHDLLFHSRSREGRYDAPLGATYYWAGEIDVPPPLKPVTTENAIPLDQPDADSVSRPEPSFQAVLEQRRSIREFGAEPLTKRQLGEFLYRAARVRDSYAWDIDTHAGPVTMSFLSRPYPAGGALHELEIYPVVQRCAGLDAGLYRYDAVGHRLIPVAGATPEVAQLIENAAQSAGVEADRLQVVLVLASRFQRVAWKYSSMAYALTLKNVGVLYQTMYLVATAMDLAPCALGAGDSDLFARASGNDYYAETSVGEFLLGSRM